MKAKKLFFLMVLGLLAGISGIRAQQITVPKVFSNGMVLQRNAGAPVWGKAPAGTKIEIQCSWNNEISYETVTDASGNWRINVETPDATPDNYGPYTVKISGLNEIVIEDVLIGEVWLNSGQSNMSFRVFESWNDHWRVEFDNIPEIRVFTVPFGEASSPQFDVPDGDPEDPYQIEAQWAYGPVGSHIYPENNPRMCFVSAIAYHFAKKLWEELGIPVGMLSTARGGTGAEEWTDSDIVNSDPEVKQAYDYPGAPAAGGLYNAMLKPLAPYKISGFIWYQGENNAGRYHTYKQLSKLMVENWRDIFENDYLPFYLVQLTSFGEWQNIREVQHEIANEIPNAAMAVTMDVGEADDIHPHSKKPVADRLAGIALAKVYGKTGYSFSSPVYRKMEIEGNAIRIYFDFADKGLIVKTDEHNPDGTPQHFEIAGEDNIFHKADARVEGNTVVLSSKNVPEPKNARYLWVGFAHPNLFTEDQPQNPEHPYDYYLPVAPFRTNK